MHDDPHFAVPAPGPSRRALVFGGLLGAVPAWAAGGAPVTVVDQSVRLWPDFDTRTLRGEVTTLVAGAGRVLVLDIGRLQVDAVAGPHGALDWQRSGTRLTVAVGAVRQVRIRYRGAPTRGLFFHADLPQVHTAFATSEWMPCVDDPSQRSRLTLAVALPPGLVAAGSGERGPDRPADGGHRWARWRLATPMPSFLFAFAAGPFTAVTPPTPGLAFDVWGAPGFDRADLLRLAAATPAMAAFYAGRAGVPYPGARYGQVLLAGRAAQEAAGLALLGASYGRRVLDRGAVPWLGAHELAHQWWGAGLTNASWNHIWLNEGLGSYLTAECLGACVGPQAFDDAVGAAEDQWAELRRSGRDRPLLHPDWSTADASDRSVVYDKGTVFVHALRRRLGEARFGAALRDYTHRHWGGAVTSADFQAALQRHSADDLGPMFAEWVYGG